MTEKILNGILIAGILFATLMFLVVVSGCSRPETLKENYLSSEENVELCESEFHGYKNDFTKCKLDENELFEQDACKAAKKYQDQCLDYLKNRLTKKAEEQRSLQEKYSELVDSHETLFYMFEKERQKSDDYRNALVDVSKQLENCNGKRK